ncbi:hypothetical protein RJ639_044683 [Escallonia herrerae]|uniref:Integrase catalytic domain-containing protein n=1 Tax=Escallonia herrerae TaxID=1293975 RepID=A0AA88WDV3_9ASTE|nr:hypothetical protein RJ639_044683 [Escallonia herrerae]
MGCFDLNVTSPAAIIGYLSSIESLSGTNFRKWKEQISIILRVMDLDYALRVDAPLPLRLKALLSKMRLMKEQFQGSSKARVTTLITKMVTLKYSGSNGVREHILRMNDMASQLKGLDMEISEGFLVLFIMTSLPAQFGPFKINYNTQKEKWKMSELISMCVQEEERLKSEQPDNAHVAITGPSKGKGKGKKFGKGNVQGNKSASITKTDKASSSGTRGSSGPRCHFCKDKGHMRKECHKFREWLAKKGNLSICVCYESYTIDAPLNTWLDAYGNSFKFENKGFSLFFYARVIGSGLLERNLYKLLLNASFTESLKKMNVNDVVAKTYGTPQQNGVAERKNRTLMDMVRSMICQSTLPEFLWVEALKTAVHILNRVPKGAVSWKSAKQSLVASDTMEAEFVACFEASCHGVWLKNFITGLKVVDSILRPLKIFCDNQAAVFFSKNNKSSGGTKHIEIKYLVVRERIHNQIVSIQHISTIAMLADPMTKGLPPTLFREHVASTGLVDSLFLR